MFKRKRLYYFVVSFITLICGALIYPLFRESNLLVWKIFKMPDFWEKLRVPYPKGGLIEIFVNSGPDFLWLLSGICLLRGVWFYEQKTQTVYIFILYIIAALYNAGQYYCVIPGTFDLFDLLTMTGVACMEGLIFYFIIKKEKSK